MSLNSHLQQFEVAASPGFGFGLMLIAFILLNNLGLVFITPREHPIFHFHLELINHHFINKHAKQCRQQPTGDPEGKLLEKVKPKRRDHDYKHGIEHPVGNKLQIIILTEDPKIKELQPEQPHQHIAGQRRPIAIRDDHTHTPQHLEGQFEQHKVRLDSEGDLGVEVVDIVDVVVLIVEVQRAVGGTVQ
jgi:hypothetical protein